MLVLRHISPTASRSLEIETRSVLIGRSQECDVIVNERGVADVAIYSS